MRHSAAMFLMMLFLFLSRTAPVSPQEPPPAKWKVRVDVQMGEKDGEMKTALENGLLEALRKLPDAEIAPDGNDLILDVSGVVVRVGKEVKGVAVSLVVKQPATGKGDGVYRLFAHQLRLVDREGMAGACADIAEFINTSPLESLRKERRNRLDMIKLLKDLGEEPEPEN